VLSVVSQSHFVFALYYAEIDIMFKSKVIEWWDEESDNINLSGSLTLLLVIFAATSNPIIDFSIKTLLTVYYT
jgi:hypothetical protein